LDSLNNSHYLRWHINYRKEEARKEGGKKEGRKRGRERRREG
jgi:hypothetical protein